MPENNSKQDVLADLSHLPYFEVDAARNVTKVSPALEALTGFAAQDVIGKPCITLMRCEACLKECGVFRRGRVDDARVQIYRSDGEAIEVLRSGVLLRDGTGAATGAVETVMPVTGDHAATDQIPEELDVLLSALGRLFIAADEQLRVVAFSPSLPEQMGWSEERLNNATLIEIFGDQLFGPLGPLHTAVTAGKRKEGWHASLPSPDGGHIPVSISVGTIGDEDRCGRPEARVIVMIRPDGEPEAVSEQRDYQGIVGRSAAMRRIFRLIDLLRDNDATVLITGESGTGKELVARAIHATSSRAAGPFVAVNCAALPGELLESELFGHVRGAFTGAVRDRPGRFELAHGGTLFLDEIGDLAAPLQAKILRALEDHTFERVGDTRTRTVDVRVVAATNADLARAVTEHRFREDLYYRLRVIPVEIPPLRERREDLPALIDALLGRITRHHQRALRLAGTASRALLAYDWPGNVRELENALEYAVTVCSGQTIHVEDLPPDVRARRVPAAPEAPVSAPDVIALPSSQAFYADRVDEIRKIREALIASRYDRTLAARSLGISRTTLWRKMKQYQL